MQIVIEIPDKKYEALKMLESATIGLHLGVVEKAIINGTPLPKGHGRLIDADAIHLGNPIRAIAQSKEDWMFGYIDAIEDAIDVLDGAHTIVEADKEGNEDANSN